jgi:hypothetical protein
MIFVYLISIHFPYVMFLMNFSYQLKQIRVIETSLGRSKYYQIFINLSTIQ